MKALIAGAGIGGLTAALCLHRIGWGVEILEQAADIAEVGAGLQVSPNGMKVLDALGVGQNLRKLSYEPEILGLRMGLSGRRIFEIPMKSTMQRRYGAPYLQVHRADLIEVLRNAVETRMPGALRTGARVTKYTDTGESVCLYHPQGTSQGDILIGADGVHSAIRAEICGPEAPVFTGNAAWRAVVPRAALDGVDIPPGAVIWAGAGRHAVTYPLRGGELVNFVGIVEQDDWRQESWTAQGDPAQMARDFSGWAPLIQRLITAAPHAFKWALLSRPPLAHWSKGRAVLLGDACHPMLPSLAQGACQAIEDAWVLAHHLATASPMKAFQNYQIARHPRTSAIQKAAAANVRLFHKSGPGWALVYPPLWTLGQVVPSLLHQKWAWVYGHDVTTTA